MVGMVRSYKKHLIRCHIRDCCEDGEHRRTERRVFAVDEGFHGEQGSGELSSEM